jgi:hypothetical protein
MHGPVRAASSTPPIDTIAEGEQLIARLHELMDALLAALEAETDLVRAGRLSEVARLEPRKAELARRYLADAAVLRASSKFLSRALAPAIADLRRHHDTFHAVLQMNLTVLATAHAVSEGIVRGVADDLARKAAPTTYGATGRMTAPATRTARPFALSRQF